MAQEIRTKCVTLLDTPTVFDPGNLVELEFENFGGLSGVSRPTAPSEQHTSSSTFWIHVLSQHGHCWSTF